MPHKSIIISIEETLLELLDEELTKNSKPIKRSPFVANLIREVLLNKSFKFLIDDELCAEVYELKKRMEKNNLIPVPMEEFVSYIFTQGLTNVERHLDINNAKEAQKIADLELFNRENQIDNGVKIS